MSIIEFIGVDLRSRTAWGGSNRSAAAPEGFVFPWPQTGEALTHTNTAWRNVTKKAGLAGLRLHDLRHTFATGALAAGANISELQSMPGHADITTAAIYLHPGKEGKRRAVEAMIRKPADSEVLESEDGASCRTALGKPIDQSVARAIVDNWSKLQADFAIERKLSVQVVQRKLGGLTIVGAGEKQKYGYPDHPSSPETL